MEALGVTLWHAVPVPLNFGMVSAAAYQQRCEKQGRQSCEASQLCLFTRQLPIYKTIP